MTSIVPNLSVPEMNWRFRQQDLVAGFGRFALQTDSLQRIFDEASMVAAEGLDARFAKVLEYLPGEMGFVVRSGVGWREGIVGHARVGGDLQSPAGYAFRSGKPVISNHLCDEQRFRTPKLLEEHGIRSAINVLIQACDGEPFGVLEGDSTHRGDFNDQDIAFLQALANTLAVAVQAQKRQDAREELLVEKEVLLRENQVLIREKDQLLHEKDLLMQEVHHRVKNSLQLVRAVLSMQARTLESPEARGSVEAAAGRVLAIAAVHHRLYEGGSVTAADAARYLRGLLDDMGGLLPGVADGRTLELDIEPFQLAADDIAPLGLITVELITNALKHGRGSVRVAVRRDAGGLEISVSDQGGGFPAGFDPGASQGLGMRMVTALAKGPCGSAVQVDRSVPFGRIIVRTGFGGNASLKNDEPS
jgi:two-component sensor histidine kinase